MTTLLKLGGMIIHGSGFEWPEMKGFTNINQGETPRTIAKLVDIT
jgi:hypothetical protein